MRMRDTSGIKHHLRHVSCHTTKKGTGAGRTRETNATVTLLRLLALFPTTIPYLRTSDGHFADYKDGHFIHKKTQFHLSFFCQWGKVWHFDALFWCFSIHFCVVFVALSCVPLCLLLSSRHSLCILVAQMPTLGGFVVSLLAQMPTLSGFVVSLFHDHVVLVEFFTRSGFVALWINNISIKINL